MDANLHQELGNHLATRVNDGELIHANISGSPTDSFSGVDLPIYLDQPQPGLLSDLGSLYTELRSELDSSVIPSAEVKTIDHTQTTLTYGSADSPATVLVQDDLLKDGQTLTGYGTLIVSQKFVIESGSTLNWNGDIIIYGGDSTDPELEVNGNFNVDGSISLVGAPTKDAKIIIKQTGTSTLTGALTMYSDYAMEGTRTDFFVEGSMTLDGLLTLIGPKQQIEFKDTSDVNITGMFQMGSPERPPEDPTELQLKFEGNVEIHMDPTGVGTGLEKLGAFGSKLDLESMSVLVKSDFRPLAWYPVYQ